MSEQWEAISPPAEAGRITLRRADASHPFDFFRGRDHEGRYLFALQGDFSERRNEELPKLSGIDIGISRDETQLATLLLTLFEQSQEEIFRALCSNLMVATQQVGSGNYEAAVDAIIGRVRRWQELLKNRREKQLTRSEQVGLFGELLVLRDIFLERLEPLEGVSCWRGPEPDEQDFQKRDWMIEVKTQISSSDSRMQIANENQLDTVSGKIALCHQRIGVADSSDPSSRTLNDLVEEVFNLVSTVPAAADRFSSLLIECGYEPKPAYGSISWRLNTRDFFEVRDGFPRVVSAILPSGVDRVR